MAESISILFYPGGGLGDTVVSLPVIFAIHEYFGPGALIDVTTGQNIEALREIYHGIPFVQQILPNPQETQSVMGEMYDLLVIANEQVVVEAKEKAQIAAPDFITCIQDGFKKRDAFGVVNRIHNMANNQLGNHAVLLGLNRRSLPLYSLGMPNYLDPAIAMQLRPGALAVLDNYGLSAGEFITVQDGWDANFPLNRPNARPTKAWYENSWAELVAEIKRRHPEKKIVQLGSPINGFDIQGVDVNLRGKARLHDSLAILKYAALHVDTEGGLVHMVQALHTRCVVLFGPTNEKFFGYAGNKNLVPPCNNCWWLTNDWMSDCVRGLAVPECMMSHQPMAVADAVSECLAQNQGAYGTAAYGTPPSPAANSRIGIVNNAALAAELGAAGHDVTHFDLTAQKNIQKPIAGMQYRQFLARMTNLPLENQTLDYLVFTADTDANEFAAELLEALRVLKIGGCAVITTADQDTALAFAKAKLAAPTGSPVNTLILTRTA